MGRSDWLSWLWRVALFAAVAFGLNGTARAAFPLPSGYEYEAPNGSGNWLSPSAMGAMCDAAYASPTWPSGSWAFYEGPQRCGVAANNTVGNPHNRRVNQSCPPNSTLANGECTCTAPQVQNAANNGCEAPPPNSCAPDGTIQDANTTTRYSIPGTGSTACHQGCLVVFEYTNGSGANRWATGPAHSMGLPCTPGGETTPDSTPQTPEQNSCPVGQCPGTVNGASVCVLCSVSHNDVQPPATGASGVPGTTTTTTVNPDGTVTTETRNPDGTTSSSSSPGSQIGIEAYCTRNPMAFICSGVPGGDNGSAAPGAPGGAASGVPGSTPTITSPNATAAPSTLYTKKYPDGLMGVWNAKREALQNSGLASAITSLVPSFGSGGCPSMDLPGASIMGLQFGGGSVAPPCWVWTMVQAVMMVTALIAARRLIFGG